ncbi:hypothetical protein [Hyphococcus luteus]|uniref:Uncharacterized protein n=1 Tax=Hyphococcus luteus TaxID=2058213 RepID=A0A2S7JYP9_9PROT|nr:hypothetical protein [Marinicaulis flavus]PQA85375.1 hypothetical protein CW354_20720 [Marinicaulis flavus]
MLARAATTLTGAILVIYGVIAAISPLPLGVVLIVLGLIMIAAANPAARPLILAMRRRWRWFDKMVRLAAHRSPPRFHETFEDTDPAKHPEPPEDNAREG